MRKFHSNFGEKAFFFEWIAHFKLSFPEPCLTEVTSVHLKEKRIKSKWN